MKDERYWPVLGTWLKDTAAPPPDPRETARRVSARLPQTPQVRRRWWLPSLRRTRTLPSNDDETSDRFAITTRGTRLMFSPLKAITAGALVFAISGAFLISQPLGQPGSLPGAEQPFDPGTGVVITIIDPEGVGGYEPDAVRDPAGYWVTDGAVYHSTWDATDPRLSGAATYIGMWHMYSLPSTQLEAVAMTVYNDDGRWVGTGRGIFSPTAEYGDNLWLALEGEGAHEGLTAYVTFDIAHEPDIGRGFIRAGELPPFPEPAE